MNRYYSHGKLLLTGEYVVLDGALALALPTSYGQFMTVEVSHGELINWISKDRDGSIWFNGTFRFEDRLLKCLSTNNKEVSNRLIEILNCALELAPNSDAKIRGTNIITSLEFPKNWGLGTSSTLINNIACWLELDPYELLKSTFGGSGYDIACAKAESSITFQITADQPLVNPVVFDPIFKTNLYFVYLNKKQDSREGIAQYRKYSSNLNHFITEINVITEAIINSSTLEEFQELITRHEVIISKCIRVEPIKSRLFSDFNGSIKSLGAWGGDFILVASSSDPRPYFKSKGYHTTVRYDDMIL